MNSTDIVQIITAAFALAGLMFTAYISYRVALISQKVEVVHKATNSIVEKLGNAREEIGVYKGQEAERDRMAGKGDI